ncbi:unnamed protein product [Prunus armeniaca]
MKPPAALKSQLWREIGKTLDILPATTNGLGYRKEQMGEITPVYEFKNQTPRMLRNGSEALGSTLVIFSNKNNSRLQIDS